MHPRYAMTVPAERLQGPGSRKIAIRRSEVPFWAGGPGSWLMARNRAHRRPQESRDPGLRFLDRLILPVWVFPREGRESRVIASLSADSAKKLAPSWQGVCLGARPCEPTN